MLDPARISVSRASGTAMARLAVTAPLASMVRTVGVLEAVVALRRRVLIMRWTIRHSSLAGALNMPDAGFFLPHVRLVRICIHMCNDGGGGASDRTRAIGRVAFA